MMYENLIEDIKDCLSKCDRKSMSYEDVTRYLSMAELAMENMNGKISAHGEWHYIADGDLPKEPKDVDTRLLACITIEGTLYLAYYCEGNWFCNNSKEIYAWTAIPDFPEYKGENK